MHRKYVYKSLPDNNNPKDYGFISDILRINAVINEPYLLNSDESTKALFDANEESYILAYHNFVVVGYICFFPIKNDMVERFKGNSVTLDIEINAENIREYPKKTKAKAEAEVENKDEYNIFIHSIAVLPSHQGRGVGTGLINEMFASLSTKIQFGLNIDSVYTITHTNAAGSWFINKAGFKVHERPVDNEKRLLYYKYDDFSDASMFFFIPFVVDEDYSKTRKKIEELASKYKTVESIPANLYDKDFEEIRNKFKELAAKNESVESFLANLHDEGSGEIRNKIKELASKYKTVESFLAILYDKDSEEIRIKNKERAFKYKTVESLLAKIYDEESKEICNKIKELVSKYKTVKSLLANLYDEDSKEVRNKIKKLASKYKTMESFLANLYDKGSEEIRGIINELASEYEAVKPYLDNLKEVSEYEFNPLISTHIHREYLGKVDLVIRNMYECVEYDEPVGSYFCLYYYRNFYIAVVFINKLKMDPTVLLSQVSAEDNITLSEHGRSDPQDIIELLRKTLNVDKGKIHKAGEIRSMTSLVMKPSELHLTFMMACENFPVSEYLKVPTPFIGAEFFKKSNKNLAQYHLGQIYASQKNVVFIYDNSIKERYECENLLLFIIELLMLQNCSINHVNYRVLKALDKNDFTTATVESINFRFSNAALLWDVSSFSYLTSRQIYEEIAAEFGIPRLKEEYRINYSFFEKMASSMSQKRIQKYMIVFTTISGFTAVRAFTSLLDIAIGNLRFPSGGWQESLIMLGIDAILVIVCVWLLLAPKRKRQKLLEDSYINDTRRVKRSNKKAITEKQKRRSKSGEVKNDSIPT